MNIVVGMRYPIEAPQKYSRGLLQHVLCILGAFGDQCSAQLHPLLLVTFPSEGFVVLG